MQTFKVLDLSTRKKIRFTSSYKASRKKEGGNFLSTRFWNIYMNFIEISKSELSNTEQLMTKVGYHEYKKKIKG